MHEALGSAPHGAVRFGFGPFNTAEHVDRAVAGLAAIATRR
jgi:cysteine sulfinate desulfinase/cysteine desulfurase-like protein